jgi:VWFA-related protein
MASWSRSGASTVRAAALLVIVIVAAGSVMTPARAQQQPIFRAEVDLIAVDVQVVDRDGQPIIDLQPDRFDVTIDGRRRKVVSANLVQYSQAAQPAAIQSTSTAAAATNQWPSAEAGRLFMLAIDLGSLEVGQSRGVVQAAQGFVQRLQSNDLVGLYTFPVGPWVAPTTDRTELRRKLDTLVGQRQSLQSQYHLSPGEVVDITAEMAALANRAPVPTGRGSAAQNSALLGNETETLRRVQLRECGDTADMRCVEAIESEATAMAFFYEGLVMQGLNGLGALLQSLGEAPGRKTVVVFSAGMPISDRVGGRPNVGDQARVLGEQAARSNTTIYALHIDHSLLQSFSAETRHSDKQPVSRERESVMLGRMLDQFAGASGGALLRVLVGSGEGMLDRVLRETSAYYLLGVEPTNADRDGHTHSLRVKVDQRGVTVRSRTWVLVPKRR